MEIEREPHHEVPTSVLPEVELFAYLLVVTFLVDQKQFAQVYMFHFGGAQRTLLA